jgi:hypothetical protein
MANMHLINFHEQQKDAQINWRKTHITTQKNGYQNGKAYDHIVPRQLWEETLWEGIRKDLPLYLTDNNIQAHTGTHNLLSSWILCANLYFITKINDVFRNLMLAFLQKYVSCNINKITNVELEFAFECTLNPENLLGEIGGSRGSGQTSPDIAFLVNTDSGKGVILTECKYTEHSFYPCSARRTTDSENKPANPDPTKCIVPPKADNYKTVCHQHKWGRKYWDHLAFSTHGQNILKQCPASLSGYQLFRQQSLAEGIAKNGHYEIVATTVAYDGRNQPLINCLKTTGIPDFTKDWESVFTGKSLFKTWKHQEWVDYVRQNGSDMFQQDWVDYLHQRYGF